MLVLETAVQHDGGDGECGCLRVLVRERVPSVQQRRSLRQVDDENDEDEDDDDSVSVAPSIVAPEFRDDTTARKTAIPDGWQPKYRFPVCSLELPPIHRKPSRSNNNNDASVTIHIRMGHKTEERVILFDRAADAVEFTERLEEELAKEAERTQVQMEEALGKSQVLEAGSRVKFLVEIVSARGLPVADVHTRSSDPFVVCSMDHQVLHKTDYISRTLDPIWTVETSSLFTFETTVHDLLRSRGLECMVYDYDLAGSNDKLGCATVPPMTVLESKGERLEYDVLSVAAENNRNRGVLAVRIRKAEDADVEFVGKLKRHWKSKSVVRSPKRGKGVLVDEEASASQGGVGALKSMVARRSRPSEYDKTVPEYKIRPGPDPDRPQETKWMTDKQLQDECLQDSNEWVDCGSGSVGQLFVEILGCDGLPNLDAGGFAGNKTDSFVSLVFEDVAVQTDIIDDCLAPRWMPWTKRAFIFHLMHGSSQLFLGVFDYDDGIGPADVHDMVGKVSVDVSNLQRDVQYTLTYNIYTTARMTDRKKKGTITIRLRLEIPDERRLMLSTLEPPPQMHVNVKNRKDLRVARTTIAGKYDMEGYSGRVINSYIDEILTLQNGSYYVYDATVSLLLWRGTLPIKFGPISFAFPMHSLIAYLGGLLVIENPELIPSAIFASISWLLFATSAYRQRLPDAWERCRSFRQCAEAALLGRSRRKNISIEPYANETKTREYLDTWSKRIADAEERAAKRYDKQLEAQRTTMKDSEDTEFDDDIATSASSVSVDPFRVFLYPVQKGLGVVCQYLRHVKHVLIWEDSAMAFWTTIGCLVLSFLCLFVPWFFLIQWIARLIIWPFPLMKLLDALVISRMKPLTPEELEAQSTRWMERIEARTSAASAAARIRHENQRKLKAMKSIMFGKYVVKVPILKSDRYRDLPTRASYATPYVAPRLPMSELAMRDAGYCRKRIQGQHLVGDMIPQLDTTDRFTEAPVGQPISRPSLMDTTSAGISGTLVANDSTTTALLRLGIVVVAAAVLTAWSGPHLMAALEKAVLVSVPASA